MNEAQWVTDRCGLRCEQGPDHGRHWGCICLFRNAMGSKGF